MTTRLLKEREFQFVHILTNVLELGLKSLGGHFACLCWGFDFWWSKEKILSKGNTFTLFIIFIVKSLQKEQNSTNLLHTMNHKLPELKCKHPKVIQLLFLNFLSTFKKIYSCWVIWSKDNLASCFGFFDEKKQIIFNKQIILIENDSVIPSWIIIQNMKIHSLNIIKKHNRLKEN